MKRIIGYIIVFVSFIFCFSSISVSAKELVAHKTYTNIFGDTLGSIQIYSNGEIVLGYRYGLRRANLLYCERGNDCDYGMYTIINIVDANAEDSYKNENEDLATYSYWFNPDKEAEYRIKVEAYFGSNSGYNGSEGISGSYTVSSLQSADTNNIYLKLSPSDIDVADSGIRNLLIKLRTITNSFILPALYVVISLILVVKGALLGFDIVKSADQIDVRREKINSLKWLVIGVAIAYAANSLVGVITGYFKGIF